MDENESEQRRKKTKQTLNCRETEEDTIRLKNKTERKR